MDYHEFAMDEHSRRKFYRTDFRVKGSFSLSDKTYDLVLSNISLKGALTVLEADPPLSENVCGRLQIFLPNSKIIITIDNATLIRQSEENETAFVFNEIDAESMIHLRRLLELNSVYEGEIERELPMLKDS